MDDPMAHPIAHPMADPIAVIPIFHRDRRSPIADVHSR
jgi:hypothetical protein